MDWDLVLYSLGDMIKKEEGAAGAWGGKVY
jgi:hypothetical protein